MSIIMRGFGAAPRLVTRGYGATIAVYVLREFVRLVSRWK